MISPLGRLRHWDPQRPNRRLFLAARSCTFPAKSGLLRRGDDFRWELVGRVSGGAVDFPEGASQPVAMDPFPETAMMPANANFWLGSRVRLDRQDAVPHLFLLQLEKWL